MDAVEVSDVDNVVVCVDVTDVLIVVTTEVEAVELAEVEGTVVDVGLVDGVVVAELLADVVRVVIGDVDADVD